MAQCKDCIHYCVCSPYTAPNESYPEVDGCKCFYPAADVVPKSEVERLQEDVERLQEINNRQVENIRLAKNETAREIFEEIEKYLLFNPYDIALISHKTFAELKKKYMGGVAK